MHKSSDSHPPGTLSSSHSIRRTRPKFAWVLAKMRAGSRAWPWIALLVIAFLWWKRSSPELVPQNQSAPVLSAELSNGETLSLPGDPELGQSEGVTVLNFWASWCGSCRSEIPDLEKIHRTQKGTRVVSLSVERDSLRSVEYKARKLGATYPVGQASAGAMRDYRVEMLPTTYVIDSKGIIKASFVGTVSESRLRNAVADAR